MRARRGVFSRTYPRRAPASKAIPLHGLAAAGAPGVVRVFTAADAAAANAQGGDAQGAAGDNAAAGDAAAGWPGATNGRSYAGGAREWSVETGAVGTHALACERISATL